MKRLIALSAVLAVAAPASAVAGQRFAAPDKNGPEPCEKAAPCSLKNAIEKAEPGDEAVVTAGTYSVGSSIFAPLIPNFSIHGEAGGPIPRIVASPSERPISFEGGGGRLAYLEIEETGDFGLGILCISGGSVERVRVKVSGEHSIAVQTNECTIRDSLLHADGTDAIALSATATNTGPSSSVARNVTAIATGAGSAAIQSAYYSPVDPGSFTLSLKNSIAIGEGADLQTVDGGFGPGNIDVSNSNFDTTDVDSKTTLTDGGGNQKAAPQFVNSAAGDYSEAAGSPTIDAGVADQLGPLDLAGGARVQGPAPDIGAFETAGPSPPAARLTSLVLSPTSFRAANIGGAVASRKKKAPVGTTVFYKLSSPATVEFSVERKGVGRKSGKRCVKQTAANKGHKKCALYKALKGSFSVTGDDPLNSFKFTGRVGGKSLKPGSYRLVGATAGGTKKTAFKVVR